MSEQTTKNNTGKTRVKNLAATAVIVLSVLFLLLSVVPRAAGYKAFGVNSGSMQPVINKGSLVLTRSVKFEDIKIGDILTFYDSHTAGYFSHRVAVIYPDSMQLVTKGDANNAYDPKTTHYSCVEGRVVHILPLLGYPYIAVNSIYGIIFFAAVFILWAAFEIEAFKTGKKEGVSE